MMKKLSTALAEFEFDNEILVVSPTPGLVMEKSDMETMLAEAIAFTNGQKYYALIDTRKHIELSLEARNYYSTSDFSVYRYADAFVVTSLPIKLVVNFYFRFNKPSVPSKMFNNNEEALEWFEELKAKASKPISSV